MIGQKALQRCDIVSPDADPTLYARLDLKDRIGIKSDSGHQQKTASVSRVQKTQIQPALHAMESDFERAHRIERNPDLSGKDIGCSGRKNGNWKWRRRDH